MIGDCGWEDSQFCFQSRGFLEVIEGVWRYKGEFRRTEGVGFGLEKVRKVFRLRLFVFQQE